MLKTLTYAAAMVAVLTGCDGSSTGPSSISGDPAATCETQNEATITLVNTSADQTIGVIIGPADAPSIVDDIVANPQVAPGTSETVTLPAGSYKLLWIPPGVAFRGENLTLGACDDIVIQLIR